MRFYAAYNGHLSRVSEHHTGWDIGKSRCLHNVVASVTSIFIRREPCL